MNNLEKIVVSLKDSRPLVKIGWTGENDARGIVWDISAWQTIYGEGTCTLLNQRETDDAPYPCSITIDGKFAVWQVTDGDLGSGGNGKCQLIYTVGEEVVAKSPVYKTLASRSLSGEIEPPDQFDSWIDQIVQAGAQAQAAASTATSKAGEASSSATSAAESAQTAQAAASTATSKAGEASSSATSAAESAQTAQEAASTATSKAGEASSSAEAAAESAQTAQAAASTATSKAGEASSSAEAAAESAQTAQTAASTATSKAGEASSSAEAAAESAQTAQAAASTATSKAQEASSSAEAAAESAQTAQAAASTATSKAGEASSSAEAAAESAQTAQAAASTATSKAGEASSSVTSAAESAQTAQAAASTATSKAGEASSSATSAAESAQTAQEAASTATSKAGEAAQSATSAAESAQTAQEAASTATSKAGEASSSATSAAESAQTAQAAASTAATKASEAAQSAEAAQESADDIKELVPIPTLDDNGKVMTVVDGKWAAVDPAVSSWEKVQLIVRAGLAPQYFPVGYEFVTHDSTEDTDIIWRVVGHDTIKAADESLIHTMILETKYVYSDSLGSGIAVQFDAQEALFCVEAGLEPGTYHFTLLSGYDEANGGGGTYSFTLTQFVPSGGVLLFNWQYISAVNGTVSTYTSQTAAAPIETVSVSEGAEGTNLGTDDGSTANMNNTPRARYGSNNYAQSAIRQWLNSAAPAGSVWHPQTKFDRPPNWAGSRAGFMAGLPQDFLTAVQPAAVPCRTNNVFEVDSLDGTGFSTGQVYILEDKFFILSCPEIYGSYDNELIKDGEQLDFYQNLTDAERIKYSQLGIATNSGMRSPYVDVGDHFRIINSPSGNFGVRVASGIWNCTASCIIG